MSGVQTTLIAVGKLKPGYRGLCDEYLKRLRRYGSFAEREVQEAGSRENPVERVREETRRVQAALPPRGRTVALDRGGEPWSSEQLARQVEGWMLGSSPVALVLGGVWGLAPEFLRAARHRWSLGPLTLPHQLARVVVLEQWYRAWTILRGEPYHHGER